MLISKAWETYAADKRFEGFSPYTIKAYGIQARLLVLYFKDEEICSISTENLKEYLNDSAATLKPSSMAHRIRFMKSLFRWCHEEGHIPFNPALKIKEPKVGKRIPKFLTEREIEFCVKRALVRWKKRCLNLCSRRDAGLVKLFRWNATVLIGPIAQPL